MADERISLFFLQTWRTPSLVIGLARRRVEVTWSGVDRPYADCLIPRAISLDAAQRNPDGAINRISAAWNGVVPEINFGGSYGLRGGPASELFFRRLVLEIEFDQIFVLPVLPVIFREDGCQFAWQFFNLI